MSDHRISTNLIASMLLSENPIHICVQVDLKKIVHTGKFDMEKASKSATWLKSLTEEHTPETEEYGISHIVYR